MKKRVLALLWVLALCMLAMPVLGEEAPTMTVSAPSSVYPGDTLTVTVSISQVKGCTALGLAVEYDGAVFEVVSGSFRLLVENTRQYSFQYNSNAKAYVAQLQMDGAQEVSGQLFSFQMKVKAGAAVEKDTAISGKASLRVNNAAVDCRLQQANVRVACKHSFGAWEKLDGSQHSRKCDRCGKTEKAAHSWDGGKVTKEPTCTEGGEKTFTCTACHATRKEATGKLEHDYDGGKVTKEPTCTEAGVKTFSCTDCDDSYTQSIEALGHQPGEAKRVNGKEPGCETDGGYDTVVQCQRCGEELESKHTVLEATGHDFDGGRVTREPTCQAEGEKTYTCGSCGDTYREKLDQIAHTYDNACDPQCNVCGDRRQTEHSYSEHLTYDSTGHWRQCENCGDVQELLPHRPGPEATATADQICLDCGFVLRPAGSHEHAANGDWLSDGGEHWHQCACGEKLDSAAHTWSEGTVSGDGSEMRYVCTVCGYPKTEPWNQPTTPPTTGAPTQPSEPEGTAPSGGTEPSVPAPTKPEPTPAEEGFPWWILGVAAAVLAAAAGIYILVGILLSRRKQGKFSK